MPRKISDEGLRKKLDGIVRELVRRRDNDRCQWCLKYVQGSDSQPSHVITKGSCFYLRWDLNNVKLLCYHCHSFRWHLMSEGRKWFDKAFPERAAYVEANKHQIVRGKRRFMEQKLLEFENITV